MGKLCRNFRQRAGFLLTLLFCFLLLQPVQGYLALTCAAEMAQSARQDQRVKLPRNTPQNTHSCGASAAVDLADSAPDEAPCASHLCCAAPAFAPVVLQSSASSPVQTELVSVHDDKMLAAMPQNSLFRPPRLYSI